MVWGVSHIPCCDQDLLGHLLALLAGILSGAAYCCVRSLSRGGEDERWTLLALPLISFPFCAKDAMLGASKHEASTWGWLLMLGLCTQLGQLFLVRGLQILPCASGTQAMYFGTLSGVVLGSILGEGLPTPETSLGAVLIVGSLPLAEWAESKESSKEGKVDWSCIEVHTEKKHGPKQFIEHPSKMKWVQFGEYDEMVKLS